MKILIRKARPSDAEGITQLWNHNVKEGAHNYTGDNTLHSTKYLKQLKKQSISKNKHQCSYVAIDIQSHQLIGVCGFHGRTKGRTRHRVEMAWSVRKEYQREGIATRMVSELIKEAKKRGFKRVEAEAAIQNEGSVRLAKKLGLKIEGKKKAGLILDNGKYADTYVFGKIL